MKNLIIVGGGGFGREAICLVREMNDQYRFANNGWNLLGVLDDHPSAEAVCKVPVLGPLETCMDYRDAWYVVAVGTPRTRMKIVEELAQLGIDQFATLIHPSVRLSEFVTIGEGSIICAGCVLTTQIEIGKHCILNLNDTICHDAILADFCTLAPQVAISGNVHLGQMVEVATGASIIPGISVGAGNMIGAGAVVTKDIEAKNGLYVGVPAQYVKQWQV